MKKLFTILSIIAGFACCAQAQIIRKSFDESDTAMMRLQIMMPIKITQNNVQNGKIDTSISILVDVVNIDYTFKSNTSEMILMLQPNMDYNITFQKNGYVSKKVFVSTKNVHPKYRYVINTTVDLKPGKSSVPCGKVLFNEQKENFISNVTGVTITPKKDKARHY